MARDALILVQYRRGTAAAWVSGNPTLAALEFGYETDTGRLKIGDGSTAWNDLGYAWGETKWIKKTVNYTDLQTASMSNNIEIHALPKRGVVHAIRWKVTTAFSGGSIATITGSLGITGTLTKYVTAASIASTGFKTDYLGPSYESDSAGVSMRLAAISTGANLSDLSAGAVDIWMQVSMLP